MFCLRLVPEISVSVDICQSLKFLQASQRMGPDNPYEPTRGQRQHALDLDMLHGKGILIFVECKCILWF